MYGSVYGLVILTIFTSLQLVIALPATAESTAESSPPVPPTETTETVIDAAMPIPTLPPLLVTSSLFDLIPSSATLTQEQIGALPARNGSLTEVLPLLPGIQASDLRSPSDRGGEIKVPELSISGAAFYQNTYRIDGVAIDSKLDPVANNPNDISDIPGQSINISPSLRLVEQVTVYDHNVPARFGNFNGGVVDIVTRSPGTVVGGAVHLRGTRDEWTQLHVHPDKEDSFYTSRSQLQQPEFDKYDAGAEIELPISEKSGLFANLQTVQSNLRLDYFDAKKSQRRRADQYFLKLNTEAIPRNDLTLTFNATPTRNEYFIESAKDSDFTLGSNNYLYALKWVSTLPFATITTSGGVGVYKFFREAPTHWYNWRAYVEPRAPYNTPTSKDWGIAAGLTNSREGGFGSLEKDERTLQLGSNWDFQPLRTGTLLHRINSGFEVERVDASFERPETTYM